MTLFSAMTRFQSACFSVDSVKVLITLLWFRLGSGEESGVEQRRIKLRIGFKKIPHQADIFVLNQN